MSFTSIVKSISDKTARPLLIAKKNSPTTMFVIGVTGVLATVVLASRATLRVEEILDETEADLAKVKKVQEMALVEYTDGDRYQDITKIYVKTAVKFAKLYGPAVIVGAASIGALAGSNAILARRNATLTAAYGALSVGFNEYRKRVSDKFGPEAERDILLDVREREIVEEGPEGPIIKTIKEAHLKGDTNMYTCLFDETSKNWQRGTGYNQVFLKGVQLHATDMLRKKGHLFINDVREMLGLPETSYGQILGWVMNGECSDNFVDFNVFDFDPEGGESFLQGDDNSVWLTFNADGIVFDLLPVY